MRAFRFVLLGVVLGLVVFIGHPRAQAPATASFYGIGDLPTGATGSAVRDATRVDGTIYAVGAGVTNDIVFCTSTNPNLPVGCLVTGNTVPNLDTPILWSSTTGIEALPNVTPYPHTTPNSAYAITPDAAFIASQLRVSSDPTVSTGTNWIRVQRSLLPSGTANLNLSTSPGTPAFANLAISDPGIVSYGQQQNGTGGYPTETRVPVRYELGNGPNVIDLTPTGRTWGVPIPRGTSSDGSVMIGMASNGAATITPISTPSGQVLVANTVAFRYVHNPGTVTGTTSVIPFVDGSGTWNMPVALTPSGSETVVIGNSTSYPNGEVYLTDASNAIISTLGSPNMALSPRPLGGVTADGVVAVTFASALNFGPGQIGGLGLPPGGTRYAYIHNSHGWFHFSSVLAEQGIDLTAAGWDNTNFAITGVRTVEGMDLVFGQGRRRTVGGAGYVNGDLEGFVAQLPAGTLAAFNPQPVASDQSLVGAWAFPDTTTPSVVFAFMADGTYYGITSAGTPGFERGLYTLASNGGAYRLTTLYDTNGTGAPSFRNGQLGVTITVAGDDATFGDENCATCPATVLHRVSPAAGSIVGGWVGGTPALPDSSDLGVFFDSASGFKYFYAHDGPLTDEDGAEIGTYTWDPITHELIVTPTGDLPDTNTATLSRDELALHVLDGDGHPSLDFVRIVSPATVLPIITNATLEADGAEDSAFSFTITAVNGLTFGATGLPAGLTLDPDTGVISGFPRANGTFNVTITTTNTFGDTDSRTLVLTFTAPPASFHGIGDLPGGAAGSAVRDATRVDGSIYAVGSSVARDQNICTSTNPNMPAGCIVFPNLESPVWWRWTGSGDGTLEALPEGAVHDPLTSPGPPTNQIFAYAITPDAHYIAGQAHFTTNGTGTGYVRDTNDSGMLSIFSQGLSSNIPQVAHAMSDDGATLYGTRSQISALVEIVGTGAPGTTATITTPLPLPAGTTLSQPVARGTSASGDVMVGVASNGGLAATNGVAFRYLKTSNTTNAIPPLMVSGWNYPVAVSTDGTQTVIAGNSEAFPNGEVYLVDAGNNIVLPTLGSPNTALTPKMLGGMTADGAIIATFGIGGNNPTVIQAGGKYAYVHNSHGWFPFSSVLVAQGIDLVAQDWDPTNLAVTGVRTVEGIDLVFGQGRRRTVGPSGYVLGALEGFVAQLPAGALASFNPMPTPPADQSIVGTWLIGADQTNPGVVLNYLADGTFVRINFGNPVGVEQGHYMWAGNAAGGAFQTMTLYDTDGTAGTSNGNGALGRTQTVTGDTFTFTDTHCPVCGSATGTRLTGSAGSIIGGWLSPYPATTDNFATVVFTGLSGGNKYYFASHGPDWGGDDIEVGTYTWDAFTHDLALTPNGDLPNTNTATLSRDELALHVIDGNGIDTFDFTRIVAPEAVTPAITNATLSASGAEDSAFSLPVTAINALAFEASGLPGGLTIDPNTGLISGTALANGVFNVEVTVTNTFGATYTETFVLTIAGPSAASIYGIGDLPGTGAVASAVRDATRVNGAIYAVGASAVNNTTGNQLDTPVLFEWTGGPTGTLQALPHSPLPGQPDFVSTQTGQLAAYALTPDAAYIASQALRASDGFAPWVRVSRSLLPSTTANLDINLSTPSGVAGSAGISISDAGTTLYGQGTLADTTRRAIRYEIGVGANYPPLPPGSPAGTWSFPIPRGTSSDGLVMIGFASSGNYAGSSTPGGVFGYPVHATNTTAFRYVHDAGLLTGTTTAIPKLSAAPGAWNFPIAMSPDGAVTVVAGNSDDYPNGEIYLTDAANAVTASLGSPNTGMTPRMMGGRTSDGAVVVTFANDSVSQTGQIGGLAIPPGSRLPYVHNTHGWFLLGSVLRAQALDLEALNWSPNDMVVTGVRTVEGVDLVFGQARRRTLDPSTGVTTNGAQEGFVIKLPGGALATFDQPVTAPPDDAIVGGWTVGAGALVMTSDGHYVDFTQGAGVYQNSWERGSYTWAGNGGEWRLTTRADGSGSFGTQGFSTLVGRTLTVAGDSHTIYNTHCNPGVTACGTTVPRIVGTSDSIIGAWTGTVAAGPFAGTVVTAVFTEGLRYFVDYDVPGAQDDFELGTYSFDLGTHTLTTVKDGGGGSPELSDAVLSHDGLGLVVTADGVTFPLTRVTPLSSVAPVITVPPAVSGSVNAPFNYLVQATWTQTFGAAGLPSGLSLDTATGVISGTPTTPGFFPVTLSASNGTGTVMATLNLTIASVVETNTGTNVVVTPEVPDGTPSVSLQFDSVEADGDTSIGLVDPAIVGSSLPDLPGDLVQVEAGGETLVYQITTSATVQGSVTICFVYPPDAFVGETPRLLHFDEAAGQWIDITSSVIPETNTICGTATSFSPFAIVKPKVPTPFLGTTTTTITFDTGTFVYRGTPFTATAVAQGPNGFSQSVPVVYAGDCLNVTSTNGCTAKAAFPGTTSYSGSTASASITITKAPSETVVTPETGPYVYRGTAFAATGVVTGVGGLNQPVSVSYVGDCTFVTADNGCTVTATFAGDANHQGSSDSKSLTVLARSITVTAQPNTKEYDGNTSAAALPVITDGTLAPGDTGTFTEAYSTPSPGTGKILTPTGFITNAAATDVTSSYAITWTPDDHGVITEPPAEYTFNGFFAPIDMPVTGTVVWNAAKAGQTIPVKWHLASNGVPETSPSSFDRLMSYPVSCTTGSSAVENAVEEYVSGNSALQNMGDGNWQYNWKTPSNYKGTCRVMYVHFSDGTNSPGANFKFK